MKKLIKNLFPQTIWDYLRYLKILFLRRGYFGQGDMDRKLEKYLDYKDGFFVELGAYDGYTGSNTFYLENKKNWRGVLIEPSLNHFLSCCYYRKKNNYLYCNACVSFEYKEKYVDLEYAGAMTVATNVNLDIKDLKEHLNYAKTNLTYLQELNKPIKFGAEARTLNSILDESNAPKKIDFLSLDVEGAEQSVLKGVNLDKYEFKYILSECRDVEDLSKFLSQHEYTLIEKFDRTNFLFSKNIKNFN